VLDVQLAGNIYMRWQGQPLSAMSTTYMMNELTDHETVISGNSSAIIAAFGNNYTSDQLFWWPAMQDIAGVIPLYRISERGFGTGAIRRMNDIFSVEGETINDLFPTALKYADADSAKWLRNDAGTNFKAYSLLPFVQLAHYNKDDWKFYSEFNSQDKEDVSDSYFFKALCAYFKTDFSPFFDQWGISLNDEARRASSVYPLLDKTLWNYDPLLKPSEADQAVVKYDTTTYIRRHNRRDWYIMTFGGPNYVENYEPFDDGNNTVPTDPRRMIDGNKGTFWHAAWRTAVSLPHYIVIDMKEKTTVDGLYIAYGNRGSYRIREMIVQTLDAEADSITNDQILSRPLDTSWSDIAKIRAYNDPDLKNPDSLKSDRVKPHEGLGSNKSKNELFFEFSTPQELRFIRIYLPKQSLSNSNLHNVSEFGTFYRPKK
jgi:hypothetical protein